MKKIALIAALVLAAPAWSQEAKPPAEAPKAATPEAPKAATPEAPKAATPEAPKTAEASKPKAPRKVHPSRRQEDARHCLEKGSNEEIIKCAEAYL